MREFFDRLFFHLDKRQVQYTILFVFSLLQIIYNANLPLYIDEAYYWDWSNKLEVAYFDHPPMIAYIIALTTLMSDSEWCIRFISIASIIVTAFVVMRFAEEIYGARARSLALAMTITLPITNVGATLAVPDAPLMLFWSIGSLLTYKALFEDEKLFVWAGLIIGFMMLSKYTSAIFVLWFLLYILLYRRDVFTNKYFLIGVILSFLVVLPMIYWNYKHNWISFAMQYSHGTGSHFEIKFLLEYLGGLFIVITPLFFIFSLMAVGKLGWQKDSKEAFFYTMFLTILLFFAYKGLSASMGPNWFAMICTPAMVLISGFIVKNQYKNSVLFALAFNILLVLLIKLPSLFGLPANLNFQNRLYGYKEAVMEMQKLHVDGEVYMADHLTTVAISKYYIGGHPDVFIPFESRYSQYNLWGMCGDKSKNGILLATDEINKPNAKLIKKIDRHPGGIKDFYIYRVRNE